MYKRLLFFFGLMFELFLQISVAFAVSPSRDSIQVEKLKANRVPLASLNLAKNEIVEVAEADLNGDGKKEILVVTQPKGFSPNGVGECYSGLSVFRNENGKFSLWFSDSHFPKELPPKAKGIQKIGRSYGWIDGFLIGQCFPGGSELDDHKIVDFKRSDKPTVVYSGPLYIKEVGFFDSSGSSNFWVDDNGSWKYVCSSPLIYIFRDKVLKFADGKLNEDRAALVAFLKTRKWDGTIPSKPGELFYAVESKGNTIPISFFGKKKLDDICREPATTNNEGP